MEKFSGTLNIPFDKKIGVLYGGMSSEREVSLRSGKNCFEAIKRLGYKNVELIDVDKNVAQTLLEKSIEIAYLALHGKYGEDGCIQGLLEILGIPYSGSGVRANAIGMNKDFTKKVLQANDLPIINSITVDSIEKFKEQSCEIKYPIMIKPVSEGSSIGMAKVSSESELVESFKDAQSFNKQIMLEEYITGKSITVGVLDLEKETISTPILEFRTKTEWYDFEAKYTDGMTEFILPAELSEELTAEVQELSAKAHIALGAKGMSRVDFVISEDNTPYILEINTIPGMTDLSDLPAQAKSMGITYDNLVGIILNSATLDKN